MSAMDYRSWGQTQNCKGCRFWSEMLAEGDAIGVRAVCLNSASPASGNYTRGGTTCAQWVEGSMGAIDQPGGDPYAMPAEDAGELTDEERYVEGLQR